MLGLEMIEHTFINLVTHTNANILKKFQYRP